ncbi:MAG: AI-2E family transporter [Clostridia bacterium]|nr:AI-2E family transporter [Clostridia bacterium]
MKFEWNKKYFQIAVYALIVLLILTFVIFAFIGLESVASVFRSIASAFTSLIYGVVLAFLVNPLMKKFSDLFAFLTADDKIPELKEETPVPEEPKKPVKPESKKSRLEKIKKTDDIEYYQKVHDIGVEYCEEMNEYRRLIREYSSKMREIDRIKKRNAYISKNREKDLKKIIRVTSRHKRINATTYSSGNKDVKTRYILRRALAVTSALVVVLLAAGVFAYSVVPSIAEGTQQLLGKLPGYVLSLMVWIRSLPDRLGIEGDFVQNIVAQLDSLLDKLYGWITDLLPMLTSFLESFLITVKDVLIGCFFAIYFLLAKERVLAKLKKLFTAILPESTVNPFFKICRDLNTSFGSFITAKLFDSLIIGIITFVFMLIFNIPYAALIALVVGVTNVIPMFGPFIGAIPSAFIILVIEPSKCLTFIILILAIQQFDGNVLGPRILGAQVKSTSLGILTALTIFSTFWGLTGLVIAVPVFSVLYELIKTLSERALVRKGLDVDTRCYYTDDLGRNMSDEVEIKKSHKSSLTEALESSSFGRLALRTSPVANFTKKVDEIDKTKLVNNNVDESIIDEKENL